MATFQIKNFVSIVASMINHARAVQTKITDFNIGSKFRTLLESVAIEIDELYQQLFNGLMAAIPVATYNSFNFQLLPAVSTTGQLTVNCTSSGAPVLYKAGTVWTSPTAQTSYVQTADVTIPPSTTSAFVPVAAQTPGALGNLAAGASFTCSPTPVGFLAALNATNLANGLDLETDDQRARRFVSFITTLSRGTVDALEYGATTATVTDSNGNVLEQVKFCSVVEINLLSLALNSDIPPVDIYVHNGVGNTSGALVAQALLVLTGYIDNLGNRVPGWKAAGIPISVQAATEVPVPVTATIVAAPGFVLTDLQTAVVAAIEAYSLGLGIGGTCIFTGENSVVSAALTVPGVADIIFTTPTGDVAASQTQKLMPGLVTLIAPSVGTSNGAAVVVGVG